MITIEVAINRRGACYMSTQRQLDMKFDLTYPSEQIKIVQRLGEKTSTDILVQVFNKGVPYNLAGMTLGFELRTDNNKIIIDKEQSRFTIVEPLKGVFSYRMHPNAQSFEGNAYIAYFTFEQGGARITTERFRVLNDEDVQNVCAPDVQQHYVSVIDDLVASNQSAMAEAQAIRDMINANQVVKKTDIYSDYLQSSGNTKVLANGTDLNSIQATGCYGGNAFVNAPEGLASYLYLEVLRYSDVKYVKQIATVLAGGSVPRVYVRRMSNNVWEPWFESISSAGGTVAGALTFDSAFTVRGIGATYDQRPQVAGVYQKGFRHTINTANNYYAVAPVDEKGAANWSNQLQLDGNTGKLTVSEIATRKDGRAILTLTADAVSTDPSYLPIATRRGNIVTIKFKVTRNLGSSSSTITTLPEGNRPTEYLEFNTLADDGTPVKLSISSNGVVNMYSSGKSVAFVATYVVD